ncbi:hypothetical protein EBN88_00415 [Streptomyces triticirhizae]|uniref:Uncharacterized protein n=1 Tax=Streptomyces triticirhizae TaxID=2483353 RepID=A0A3M2MB46_9ACTN|nr:hypothetical protein EBN88_00415 [Streptomyces triticirhizae]
MRSDFEESLLVHGGIMPDLCGEELARRAQMLSRRVCVQHGGFGRTDDEPRRSRRGAADNEDDEFYDKGVVMPM